MRGKSKRWHEERKVERAGITITDQRYNESDQAIAPTLVAYALADRLRGKTTLEVSSLAPGGAFRAT